MNTNIYQTIRVVMVLGVALFAFVDSALAAPVLTPATAKNITENSATISAHVSNDYKNATVWFEIFNNNNIPTAVGSDSIWNEGTFQWNLYGLNQGQTYTYRAAASEGGVTVYSPVSTFTTLDPKPTTNTTTSSLNTITSSNSSNSTNTTNTSVKNSSTTNTQTSAVKSAQATTQKAVTATSANTKTASTVAPVTDGFGNGSAAAVIGVGNGMFPTTLIGWIVLLIMVLAAVLIGHMIFDSAEKRKEAREKKMRDAENAKISE